MHIRYRILFLFFLLRTCTPSAHSQESTIVGGYGELHYNKPEGTPGTMDFHRFVLFLSHVFNQDLVLKSEIELEHTKIEAGEDEGGELAIEQAYLDWHLSEPLGLRAGLLLMPIGIVNELHEPSMFHGVERPNVDRVIIPSTWRESGLGLYGSFSEAVRYQVYCVAGLHAGGFTGPGGIRGGRQEGLMSTMANPSLTGRISYLPSAPLDLALSFFAGGSNDGVDSLGDALTVLIAVSGDYSNGPVSLRAVGAFLSVSDADRINGAFGQDVGDNAYGVYVEGAYDFAPFILPSTEYKLEAFARIERYNTHAQVTGIVANPAFDRTDVTFGLGFKPTYNTVFKADYQIFSSAADVSLNQLNLGIGFNF